MSQPLPKKTYKAKGAPVKKPITRREQKKIKDKALGGTAEFREAMERDLKLANAEVDKMTFDILTEYLGREPTIDDAKICCRDLKADYAQTGEFGFVYGKTHLGIIKIEMGEKIKVTFTPNP